MLAEAPWGWKRKKKKLEPEWPDQNLVAGSEGEMIAISKLDAVRLTHGDGGCFLGESSLKFCFRVLTIAVIYFHHEHLVSKSFLPVTDAVFQAEMWRIVDRTGGRTDASPLISVVFFSLYNLPKTVTITMLLLFGHVTLLCGKFLFIKLSQSSVWPTRLAATLCKKGWHKMPWEWSHVWSKLW